jgi:hypothetical protein
MDLMKKTKPTERLLELMRGVEPAVKQSDLARALRVTPTSVGRWFRQLDEGTIDDKAWAQIADALSAHGIDVGPIRPVRKVLTIDTSLTPHLDAFKTKDQLQALIGILEGSDKQQARELLLVMARDRLARL